jgi:predicted DsbA family dithiol-disulfide isomerase
MDGMAPLRVEIWSDVVCPWCYVGKRRFETALQAYDDGVDVRWRSFELDPHAPPVRELGAAEHLAAKYGMSVEDARGLNAQMTELAAGEGLVYDLDRTRGGNTFDAHRLIQLGAARGLEDPVHERLMRGYFSEGEPVGDRATLVRLAADAGLDPAEADAVLETDAYAEDVRADEALAQRMGIHGVPYFVLNRRFGVSGAQPAEVLLQAFERARQEAA